MATWDDVRGGRARPPGVEEGLSHGNRAWKLKDRGLAWERPLRKTDLAALGDTAPTGDILAIRTVDVLAKEEALAAFPDVLFTIPHFDGYPAVLARLEKLDVDVLKQLLGDIWQERAPKRRKN